MKSIPSQLLTVFLALAASAVFPLSVDAQCYGASTQKYNIRHALRPGFNEVETFAATQVVGDYWFNWYVEVDATARVGVTTLHTGSDSYTYGDPGVQYAATPYWTDSPSTKGTGTYSVSTSHRYVCGTEDDTFPDYHSVVVNEPEISNLPYLNALWYFGPGTPSAVPANVGYGGGYAYQYANLTFEKNCGGGDDCDGSPTWGEIDPEGAISVSSSGVITSTDGHETCDYNSAATATLDGWTISTAGILVNWPTGVTKPTNEDVESIRWEDSGGVGDGYMTKHPWQVHDNCGNLIPSMAINETFGTFSKPGVTTGWPDPAEGHVDRFPWKMPQCPSCPTFGDQWFFVDVLGMDSGPSTWNPDPVYTGPGPSYTYNTLIMQNTDQKWHIGTQTNGSGMKIFDGTANWYQDHGSSTK